MKNRLRFLSVVYALISTSLIAGTPVIIDQLSSPPAQSVRLMETMRLSIYASDPDQHPLIYEWSIVQDPTGKAYFMSYPGTTTTSVVGDGTIDLAFPWIDANESLNLPLVNQAIQLVVTVKHANPAEGTEVASRTFTITITGINHPPVPVISGQLGMPTNRISSGQGVICSAGDSSDPDLYDSFRADWFWGNTSGGSYKPSGAFPPMFGSEGTGMSFTVPDMTSDIDQDVVLQLTNGLHVVRTVATAYLTPTATTPPVTGANQPPSAVIKYMMGGGTFQAAPTIAVNVNSPSTITLDGSSSVDDGGTNALTYLWTKTESVTAGGVTLTNANTTTATLSLGNGTQGTVNVSLRVTDQAGLNSTTTISFKVTSPSFAPTANVAAKVGTAVVISAVEEGTVITLDGSGSTAADGTSSHLTYLWRQLSGPPVSLNGTDSNKASFMTPDVDLDGALLQFELKVIDTQTNTSDVEQATVTVNVGAMYIAQVGFGALGEDKLKSVLLLVNNSAQAADGITVEFFGSDGQPLEAVIDDQPWTNQPFSLPALSSRCLVFGGTGADVKVGWARVKSTTKLTGLVLYRVVDPAEETKREISVFSSTRGRSFATYFNASEETGLAVANPGDQPVRVTVKLIDANGVQLASRPLFVDLPDAQLAAKQHRALFVDATTWFGQQPGFNEGTLVLEADSEIIVTVIKTKEGVIFSSLPLATAN